MVFGTDTVVQRAAVFLVNDHMDQIGFWDLNVINFKAPNFVPHFSTF